MNQTQQSWNSVHRKDLTVIRMLGLEDGPSHAIGQNKPKDVLWYPGRGCAPIQALNSAQQKLTQVLKKKNKDRE